MDVFARLHSGQPYCFSDPALMEEQQRRMELLYDYNQTRPGEKERRASLLREMLAEIGEDSCIEPPFHANWGGKHLHLGRGVYANFNLTVVDDTHIYVGDFCQIGPNTVLATANHPIDPDLRQRAYQYNLPIRLGRNCWLGSGVLVMPGVTIGDNTVVGAGSVVTRDLPDNVVAAGNPCKILREINDRDREYYFKDRKIGDCAL